MKPTELGRLLGDFRLLVILFVVFRLVLYLAYEPVLQQTGERGIGTGGDRLYHYALTVQADDNLYPFRDWWSEFPPLWYLTTTSVYVLLGDSANYTNWSLVLGMIVLASEVGVLMMLRQIGTRLHGAATGMALAWIYALLALPAVFMWWNFDTLVTFALLLGVWLLLCQQDWRAVLVIAIGALTKFVPFLVFGAVIRFFTPQRAVKVIGVSLGVFALAYLPLFIINSDFALVSLTAQFGKPSYQTVWAIIDGNTTTGNFGTIESHLTVEGVNDGVGDRNPPVIPSWVRLGIAGVIGLVVLLRTRRTDELGFVAFVGITLVIFYLQSQGWSPQWLTQIIVLLLLVFPTRNGVLVALLLSALAFLEYPFIFLRTGDGIIDPDGQYYMAWVLVVALRTLTLVGVALAFYRKLIQQPNPTLIITKS